MEKIIEKIAEAEKIIRSMDHLIYVVYPLISEPKLFLKCVEELEIAIKKLISCILFHESFFKRIRISESPEKNLQTFFDKCAVRYNFSKFQIFQINELFELMREHRKNQMEFKRNENYVIFVDGKTRTINLEKVKEFILLSKAVLLNTKKISEKYKNMI